MHDAVLDYYGRRLATSSSDKTIKIFDVDGESHRLTDTLRGHDGAVWSVSWAHPKYGNILASAGYDGKVIIWREQNGQWHKSFEYAQHSASVNIVAWAPHEVGCVVACASSDGAVSLLELKDSGWAASKFVAHQTGVNSVSWAPAVAAGATGSAVTGPTSPAAASPIRRLVTGGSDCLVKIWDATGPASARSVAGSVAGSAAAAAAAAAAATTSPDARSSVSSAASAPLAPAPAPSSSASASAYTQIAALSGHSDWVRDVSWSPTILSRTYIASASQDKTVRIWTTASPNPADEWQSSVLTFDAVVWRVSWSLSGNVLAVSSDDNRITLWKEKLKGGWECTKTMEE